MKKVLEYALLLVTMILFLGCSDDQDCTKTINIPQIYFVNNQSYSYDITQEVPCDFPEPSEPETIEPPTMDNFSYEVLNFEYTPDTGNNTSRLQFEIKLNNPNEYAVSGIPMLTMVTDGLQMTGSFSDEALVPCYQIEENSSCVLTYDQQSSLDMGMANSIQLIDVQYLLVH